MATSSSDSLRLTDFTCTVVTVERRAGGGFGLVFMGPDAGNSGQWRALKTLRPELLRPELLRAAPRLRDLFLREALTWVGLWPHPNVLITEGATEINGQVFLVLEYAQYDSLREWLRHPEADAAYPRRRRCAPTTATRGGRERTMNCNGGGPSTERAIERPHGHTSRLACSMSIDA